MVVCLLTLKRTRMTSLNARQTKPWVHLTPLECISVSTNTQPSVASFIAHAWWTTNKIYPLMSFIFLLIYFGIHSVVCIMWIYKTWWNKPLPSTPNKYCYKVVVVVAPSDHYCCAIVMSYTGINKAVSQWLSLILDLQPVYFRCVARTPLKSLICTVACVIKYW